jgi:hypothetical protein
MKVTRLLLCSVFSFIFLGNAIAETLPTTPKTPNYKFSTTENGKTLSFTFWREALASSNNTVLMKVETAGTGEIFICGSSFKVIQNGAQFDALKLNSGDSSKQCHVFLSGKTFTLDQEASPKFDDKAAFSLVYNAQQIDIPAQTSAVSGGTTVSQNLNIHMSSATYQTPQGSLNISADLEYKGVDGNEDHIWKLKGYRVNQ